HNRTVAQRPRLRLRPVRHRAVDQGRGARGTKVGARSRTSPVPWLEEVEQLRLGRVGFRLEVVLPGHKRRHRREDALDAALRLKAEERAAVPHQIELDVTAAAVELPLALTFAVRRRPPLLYDGGGGLEGGVANRRDQGEAAVTVAVVQVVDE